MTWAKGTGTITIPEPLNDFVTMLVEEGFAPSNMHVIELALGVGLRKDIRRDPGTYEGDLHDAAKVGQMDPDGVLTEAILHRYGDLADGDRLKRVEGHLVAGLEELRSHFQAEQGLDPDAVVSSL